MIVLVDCTGALTPISSIVYSAPEDPAIGLDVVYFNYTDLFNHAIETCIVDECGLFNPDCSTSYIDPFFATMTVVYPFAYVLKVNH